jgi:CsoR family transcriptional regulator, copper-sensing transcriptional repressor
MAIAKRPTRRKAVDPHRKPLNTERRKELVNRLRSARGHIDHIIDSLDTDPYVIDVLQQLAAVRGSIDAPVRLGLRYYCEHGFVPAMRAGATEAAVDELMSALSFLKQLG